MSDLENPKPETGNPAARLAVPGVRLQFTRWLRAGRTRARELVDGALHERRRATARASVTRAAPVRSILFVCHGNICRSSYAEFAFRRLAEERTLAVSAESAGFVGPHRQPPVLALEVAKRRGLDMAAHRSRLITPPMLETNDLVVVMEAAQARALRTRIRGDILVVLGDLDPDPIERRTIRDPWNLDATVFEASYRRIDGCLGELLRLLEAGSLVTSEA